jgi:hypothetical protein
MRPLSWLVEAPMASSEGTRRGELAALGFSVHTGWAAAVLLAGPLDEPRVLARERVALAPLEGFDETRFVYHRSQELPLDQAERQVRATTRLAHQHARTAIAALLATASAGQHQVVGAGIGLASRALPPLADILKTHTLVHAAEGELFGQALVAGSEAEGLRALMVPPRQIPARAAAARGVKEKVLGDRMAALGKRAGRPWAQDQRTAAMLAVIVLAG